VAPVLVRNFVVGEDFVPIASQGGLNFYLGNNPNADGMAALAPEFRPTWYGGVRDATRLAEEAMGRPLKPSEVSDYWFARGIKWASESPGPWLKLTLKKILLFWQSFEIPNNEDFYFFSRYSFLFRSPLLLMFGAVAPLAIAGLVLAAGQSREFGVVAACAGLYALSISLFFVCGRFRAPIIPLLTVPAAYFLVEGLALLRRGDWRLAVPSLVVLLAAGLFVNGDVFGLARRHTFAESYLRLGIVHASAGRPLEAEASYRAAIQADPGFQEGHNNLGVLYMQQSRSGDALDQFETAYRIDPRYPRTLNNLAAWYEHENQLGKARKFIDEALAIRGDDVEVRYNAGVIYGRQGDFAGSAAHFKRLLDLEPAHQAARLGLGKSLMMERKHLDAASAFAQVIERDPRHAEALYFLGLARAQLNDLAGARRAFEACLEVRPDYEPAVRQLESLKALPPSHKRS
jgi:tetratricopeptide (TPR) repeat protein